jgi:hypothetical protein
MCLPNCKWQISLLKHKLESNIGYICSNSMFGSSTSALILRGAVKQHVYFRPMAHIPLCTYTLHIKTPASHWIAIFIHGNKKKLNDAERKTTTCFTSEGFLGKL